MSEMAEVAARGFADAMVRLRMWIETGDYLSPTPFPEALGHLYRLENSHRLRIGDQNYFTLRAGLRTGRVVGGIVYARGLGEHRSDECVARVTGARPFTLARSTLQGGDTLRGPGVILAWRPFAELPAPERPEGHERDRWYQEDVEGRDVLATFDDAFAFFNSDELRPSE